ncbi:HAMP domain-containing histidine kinase [Streptomyces buecherae]|uniref:histidine kinase n=1 Tax=Streptomyces buecherae TaxID=2763006 RepID=A0A7H8NK62_9ACTN|nr:HAMP domain-containing histidine kinase [Streptomyces buecherae]
MRGALGSVRARATIGASVVVALALVLAGAVVLGVLGDNLREQTTLQADVRAREVAARLAAGARLELDDDPPVQVVDEDGRVRAVSEDLTRITGTGHAGVRAVAPPERPAPTPTARPTPGRTPERDDDPDERDGQDERDAPEEGEGEGRADADEDADPEDDAAREAADEAAEDAAEEAAEAIERGESPHQVLPGQGEIHDGATHHEGFATVDGERREYRFAAVRVTTPLDESLTVYAGAPLATERDAVGTVRRAMLIGLPALLAVVAAVTWLVTRRALRPVEGIRREMAAITASADLSRRVPEPQARDEVARLAVTTNETLAALEGSVERQRRFVADASHELRSPIASLRTQLEVGVAHPELLDPEGAVADVVRLQHLAADLLLLARLDVGERPVRGRVALAELVRAQVARRVGDRVVVRADELADIDVSGSRGQLARVLGNLLDNAQRHAERAVEVSVRRERDARGAWAVLAVADDGAGVPEAERERIFERFVRLDDARSRDDGGAGLGLAIARDVVARHGGTLTVREAPAGGACFEVRLPGAAPAGAPGARGAGAEG